MQRFDEFSIDYQIKNSPIELNAHGTHLDRKFKLHQYQWRAISPNLMLAKLHTINFKGTITHHHEYDTCT